MATSTKPPATPAPQDSSLGYNKPSPLCERCCLLCQLELFSPLWCLGFPTWRDCWLPLSACLPRRLCGTQDQSQPSSRWDRELSGTWRSSAVLVRKDIPLCLTVPLGAVLFQGGSGAVLVGSQSIHLQSLHSGRQSAGNSTQQQLNS